MEIVYKKKRLRGHRRDMSLGQLQLVCASGMPPLGESTGHQRYILSMPRRLDIYPYHSELSPSGNPCSTYASLDATPIE